MPAIKDDAVNLIHRSACIAGKHRSHWGNTVGVGGCGRHSELPARTITRFSRQAASPASFGCGPAKRALTVPWFAARQRCVRDAAGLPTDSGTLQQVWASSLAKRPVHPPNTLGSYQQPPQILTRSRRSLDAADQSPCVAENSKLSIARQLTV